MNELPTGEAVISFLGWPSDPALIAQADQHAAMVGQMARAYCHGHGFQPDAITGDWEAEEDIRAVIVSAAARSLSNPAQDRRVEAGSFNAAPGTFAGWTLPEVGVLHRYRRMTA